ncbi:MAG: hypothetical protein PUF46_01320, partial [Oscillospiraceae bacterium]|nr:hypothetical protein [Oscillospiraceae bacterium]
YANYSAAIPMTDAQRTTLQNLIAEADAILANSSNATLKEHRDEAAELLETANATSAAAAGLIEELEELISLAKA